MWTGEVLTFEDLSNQMKLFYIDEGPYMPTLEDLIQHYQRFSDGLPINLRYPVPPKPKPPLPLFTIPRSAQKKHGSVSGTAATTTSPHHPPPAAKRNMSIPFDARMNTVGLLSPTRQDSSTSPMSTSPTTPGRTNTADILNFRSLKLPSSSKNIIIDGVKSLRKTKKSKKSVGEPLQTAQAAPVELSMSLLNVSFSSDLKPIGTEAASAAASNVDPGTELYNVPRNNAAVTPPDVTTDDASMPPDTEPPPPMLLTSEQAELTAEYFTESDNFASRDMGAEEIYFIDAPTAAADADAHSIAYTAFKVVPYFPDGTEIPQHPKVRNGWVCPNL